MSVPIRRSTCRPIPTAAIHPEGDDLFVPDQLKWMVDFDRAVAAGMGLAIDLTAEQARTGFDRLLVLGLRSAQQRPTTARRAGRTAAPPCAGPQRARVLPQGTPDAQHHRRRLRLHAARRSRCRASTTARRCHCSRRRRTRCRSATASGSPSCWASIRRSLPRARQRRHRPDRGARDAARALAGDDRLLDGQAARAGVQRRNGRETRWYLHRLRQRARRGAGDPDRQAALRHPADDRVFAHRLARTRRRAAVPTCAFLARLRGVLQRLDADWTSHERANAAFVGKPGDAHQMLLDIIGLHPSSVEYYSRYAESLTELFNIANIWGLGPDLFRRCWRSH